MMHVLQMLVDRDLPQELQHTWQINPEDVQLIKNADGDPVTLGEGAFGTVRPEHDAYILVQPYSSNRCNRPDQ